MERQAEGSGSESDDGNQFKKLVAPFKGLCQAFGKSLGQMQQQMLQKAKTFKEFVNFVDKGLWVDRPSSAPSESN
jgi:hypothetical protein